MSNISDFCKSDGWCHCDACTRYRQALRRKFPEKRRDTIWESSPDCKCECGLNHSANLRRLYGYVS